MSKISGFVVVFILTLSVMTAEAAQLSVRSFAPDYADLTASVSPRLDLNGRPCALIAVELPVPDCTFQGNIVGDTQYMGSLYRVYVTEGTKMIQILCPYCEPLMVDLVDADGNVGVASKVTYRLALDGYENAYPGATVPKPTGPNGNYLTLNITPKNNVVAKINGEMQQVDNGEVMTFLNAGTYTISVEAPGYESYSSDVTIDDSAKKKLDINLQSIKAKLTVSSTTEGATIYINDKERGIGSVTLELMPGKYILEGRKESHRPHAEEITLANRERRTVTLPALTPIYGALDVSYKPIDATVTVDNKQVGTTPLLLRDILIGKHKVTVSKSGYESFTTTVNVTEGETAILSGSLSERVLFPPREITKKYQRIVSASEGLCYVMLDDKYGFINLAGDVVIPLKYDDARSFSEGVAAVKLNGKWGYINKSDEVVIPFTYDSTLSFNEGLAWVRLNGKYGFINKLNEVVIPIKYQNARSSREGLVPVKLIGNWGFINKSDEMIIPFKYKETWGFYDGLARVKVNDKWGYINKSDEVVIPLKYEDAGNFIEGLAPVKLNGKWGYINQSDEVVIPFDFDKADPFYNNEPASVKLNGKWFKIDKQGNFTTD